MPSRIIASRLASLGRDRQVDASLRADATVEAVDRGIRRLWRDVLALLKRRPHYVLAHREALALFQRLPVVSRHALAGALAGVYVWGRRSARGNLVRTLPLEHLRAAATRRTHGLREALAIRGGISGATDLQRRYACRSGRDGLLDRAELLLEAGVVGLSPGAAGLNSYDYAGSLRGDNRDELSDAEQRRRFTDLLFPAPEQSDVARRMEKLVGHLRMQGRADLVPPDRLAGVVAAGMAAGKDPKQIAKDLLPLVDDVRASAARVARTWSIHVAHEAQMEQHEALGDLVVGYQIHSALTQHTRSWHAHRHGTAYYRDPARGQKGFAQMPRPPLEAEDPSERPAGAPRVAWNCLCLLVPILSPLSPSDPVIPVLRDNAAATLPVHATFSERFDESSERWRREAVGARAYSAVKGLLGPDQAPRWEHFVDPKGELLDVDELKAETAKERTARVQQVRQQMRASKVIVQQVATYGYVPPPVPSRRRGVVIARGEPLGTPRPLDVPPLVAPAVEPVADEANHDQDVLRAFAATRGLSGVRNFVSLVDLRRQAGHLSRTQFDAALQRLRLEGVLSLASAEGREGISPEQRAASIPEGDRLLLYVSLRPGGEERLRQLFY